MNMITNTLKEKVLYVLAIGLSIFLLFAFIGSVWIGHEAKSLCQTAVWQYGGDCTQALLSQLDDEHQGYRNRNHAIWALGQSGDSRALSTLEKYYTGAIPDREPLDETISQYELQKAIKLVKGGTNISSLIWKSLLY
ncbi:HEAT repeat domain-containing protein [Candidatus Woesebacteria bacterium]|nr:HEAT repeat domain-containing protein [Candidatus Woesebacteria bacterium]